MHALSYHPQALLNGLFKVTAYGHNLTNRLHWGTKLLVYAVKLRQIPARNFTDYIIKGRFKESRGCLCNRVFQIEKSITHAQFCSNESQRIACCLGRKRRTSAQSRVNFNYPVIFWMRVKSILYVTFANNSNVSYYFNRERTQLMVLWIGKCLRRSNNYWFAGMDAKRVEILHITYCNTVVVLVAYNLIFNLFPSF